ncbi:MAG TPA: ATP-binding protein [Polyangiaceae bacterium]|jgi:PAS domain S-box-containing protein|nr:ATP-binding protein [Polyangiaceae bacterium]
MSTQVQPSFLDLSAALESTQEGIQLVDRDFHYIYLNRAAEVHARRPRQELIGRTMMECYPGIEQSALFALMQACLKDGTPAAMENAFTYPDGFAYVFDIRIEPTDSGVRVRSIDITHGKKLEHQLRDAEQAEQAAKTTRILEEISREFAATTYDFDRLLELVARRLGELVGDMCAIRPVSQDGQWLEPRGAVFHRDPALMPSLLALMGTTRQPLGEGISGRVAKTGEPLLVTHIDSEDFKRASQPEYHEHIEKLDVATSITVPLLCRGVVVGIANLTRSSKRPPYTESDFRLAQRITSHAALAVANARSYAAEHAARDAAERAATAARVAEARFARLSECGILGILVSDLVGNIREINDALLDSLGYSRDEILSGRVRWSDLTPPEWRHVDERAIAQLKSAGIGSQREKEYISKQGKRVPVLLGSAMVEGEYCISFVLDLTERKGADAARQTAEAALRRTEEQFRHAQKMEAVGRLAGGVAHDFNNLLSVILSYAHLVLAELGGSDPLHEEIEEIRKAATRAAGLTRQLLLFSRQSVVEPKVLDLSDVLIGMDKMLQRILGEDIQLVSSVQSSLGRVRADPSHIEQVILNLVVNARDAMPKGGKLTIETADVVLDDEYSLGHVGVNPGTYVMLAVTDTGIGMDQETQKRIFEPFFTTKELGKGTGLGLSTVFGIVQQSGGTIWVYSEPTRGTTFKLYLPRVDAEAEMRRSPVPSVALKGSETVLLVEDEDQVRAVALNILKRRGYRVLVAQNPVEAEALCDSHPEPIQLLLTDVVMPEMSGPDLAERLTVKRPSMKVLCMSGYTDDSIVRHGVLKTGIAYLQKPFTPATLSKKVREVLDGLTS